MNKQIGLTLGKSALILFSWMFVGSAGAAEQNAEQTTDPSAKEWIEALAHGAADQPIRMDRLLRSLRTPPRLDAEMMDKMMQFFTWPTVDRAGAEDRRYEEFTRLRISLGLDLLRQRTRIACPIDDDVLDVVPELMYEAFRISVGAALVDARPVIIIPATTRPDPVERRANQRFIALARERFTNDVEDLVQRSVRIETRRPFFITGGTIVLGLLSTLLFVDHQPAWQLPAVLASSVLTVVTAALWNEKIARRRFADARAQVAQTIDTCENALRINEDGAKADHAIETSSSIR